MPAQRSSSVRRAPASASSVPIDTSSRCFSATAHAWRMPCNPEPRPREGPPPTCARHGAPVGPAKGFQRGGRTLTIICGWMPSCTSGLTCFKISEATRTTVVVPSPTSASCDCAMSTMVRAAGCTTSSSRIIDAPSFDTVACAGPHPVWAARPAARRRRARAKPTSCPRYTSLSMPRGPRVVRTTSATAEHALMLLTSCGMPCDVSVPSLSRMICGCCTRRANAPPVSRRAAPPAGPPSPAAPSRAAPSCRSWLVGRVAAEFKIGTSFATPRT